MKSRLVLASIVAIAAAAAMACGGTTTPSQTGTLVVQMTDSPFSDAKALLVTFSEVTAHVSGGDWTSLPFTGGASSRTCDLKKLTSATDVLGTGALAVGHYTEIRLTVSSATIYFDNASSGAACAASIPAPAGSNFPVTISSGVVKLNRQFEITNGTTTTMLLDFDGDKSVTQTGNGTYSMSPVINVVSVQ